MQWQERSIDRPGQTLARENLFVHDPRSTTEVKSAVEKLNPTEAKITVEIPYADLKPFVAETYKQLADQIRNPGFRRVRSPRNSSTSALASTS